MKCIISGSSGFLGSALGDSLPIGAIKLSRSKKEGTVLLDLTDNRSVGDFISHHMPGEFDCFIHCAGAVPWREEASFSDDITIAENVATICKNLNIRKLLFISGWVVYGEDSKVPFSEKADCNPLTRYGLSKLQQERFFLNELTDSNTIVINMRLSTVYGPGQISPGLISNTTLAAIKQSIVRLDSIKTKRDYLYIDDFIKITKSIIAYDFKKNHTINISSGTSHSVMDIAKYIQEAVKGIFGYDVVIETPQVTQESSILDNRLDISLLNSIYKGNQTTLKNGIREYVYWVRNNENNI